jgi:deazaflavin-dependent oxidoreductase (nitroreductase family)
MFTSPRDFNARIIDEFHANGGRVGGPFENAPLLLLHHTGAKTGIARINPLGYFTDGDRYVIVASNGGSSTNPDWYHNLRAYPGVAIEVGTDTIHAVAGEASGEERERLFDAIAAAATQLAKYQAQTDRLIPVIVLTPVGEDSVVARIGSHGAREPRNSSLNFATTRRLNR